MPDTVDRVTAVLGVALLNAMLVLGLMQVLRRYVAFPISVYWTGEVSRTFLAFMTLVSLPYLFKHESDISFLPLLKNVVSRLDTLLLARNLFVIVLSVVFVWSAYLAVGAAGDTGLPTLRWFKIRWGYMLVGVSFATLLVYVVADTYDRIERLRGDSDV